jgi:hypothetical protein
MKKFSFALLAYAALVTPSMANEPVAEISPPCPVLGGPGEVTGPETHHATHGTTQDPICPKLDAQGGSLDGSAGVEAGTDVVMTMTAVPGDPAAEGNVDPTLMYMSMGPVETTGGPVRHGHGDNFRDLGGVQTMSAMGGASSAKFEGLRQVAIDRHGYGPERASASDKSSLKSMFFGSKASAQAKTTLVANERVRMQKMAEVDRLRDKALQTGDAKLLAKADAMEKELKGGAKASGKVSLLFGRK